MDSTNKEIGAKQDIIKSAVMTVVEVEARIVDAADGKEIIEVSGETTEERELSISKAKIKQGGKLLTRGLWVSEDKEGLLHSLSTLAIMLRHYKVTKPKDLIGKSVNVILDDDGFMVIKAY